MLDGRALILGMTVLFSSVAHAADDSFSTTIQGVLTLCKGDAGSELQCLYFLKGSSSVFEMLGTLQESANAPQARKEVLASFGLCGQGMVTLGQIKQVFINWAEKNPRDWQLPATYGVWIAVREAWPCK